jgi:hypothetical protein
MGLIERNMPDSSSFGQAGNPQEPEAESVHAPDSEGLSLPVVSDAGESVEKVIPEPEDPQTIEEEKVGDKVIWHHTLAAQKLAETSAKRFEPPEEDATHEFISESGAHINTTGILPSPIGKEENLTKTGDWDETSDPDETQA